MRGLFVLGLTGGIGAGKSTVARLLRERGAVVVDSDERAAEILRRPEVRDELVAWWGRDVLAADGTVDRKAVAARVFRRDADRARLEALVHPLIRADRDRAVADARARGVALVVFEAPLLFEAGLDRECDAVMWVDAPRALRLARVAGRGWDEAELTRREAAQWPEDRKRSAAGAVVVNDAGESELRARVEAGLAALGAPTAN